MAYEIYKIVNNVNDKVYIGITGSMKERWIQHKRLRQKFPYSTWPLYTAMNEYGIENFSIHLIEDWPDLDTWLAREQYWIEYYSSAYPDGYNADSRSLKRQREKLKTGV